MLRTLKKVWDVIEYLVAIICPGIAFTVMFVSFCLQIFSRYVLGAQFSWTFEATVIGFLWTVAFGAIWAGRNHEHVSFSLIYDLFGPKGQAILNMIGSLMIAAAFVILMPAAYEYLEFITIKKTAVLRVSFTALYAPFLVFLIFSTIYLIRDFVRDIIILRTPKEVLLARRAAEKAAKEGALDTEEGGAE